MIEWKIAAADPRFQITHLDISRQSTSFLSEDTCPLIFPTALIQLIHQQGTGPQSGLISSASPWLQRARLPVQTVWGTLTPLLWKQLSWANQVAPMFERETREGGRLCDSDVEEIRAGGLVNLQFEPFHLSPPAACLNLQRSLIRSTSSSAAVRSLTAIFDISLVRVAELLHISSGKCTYGWTRFRWCHWEEKE